MGEWENGRRGDEEKHRAMSTELRAQGKVTGLAGQVVKRRSPVPRDLAGLASHLQ